MPRKAKTPKPLANVIMFRYPDMIERTEQLLRIKRSYPNVDSERSEAEIIAFARGYMACLEEVMHEFNCYAGFHHYGPKLDTTPDADGWRSPDRMQVNESSPDFAEWRRLYYTNGIAGEK